MPSDRCDGCPQASQECGLNPDDCLEQSIVDSVYDDDTGIAA